MIATSLIATAVRHRSEAGLGFTEAVRVAARELNLDPQRVWRAATGATNDEQEEVIAFLARDHGLCALSSLLPGTHIAHRLKLGSQKHIYAQFEDGFAWLIFEDGAFTPTNLIG